MIIAQFSYNGYRETQANKHSQSYPGDLLLPELQGFQNVEVDPRSLFIFEKLFYLEICEKTRGKQNPE